MFQGIDDAGAQVVLVEPVRIGKPEVCYLPRVEDTLVADIVDREHAARAGEQRVLRVLRVEQQRAECRVPVVAVEDLRRKAGSAAGLEGGAGKGDEASVLALRDQILEQAGAIDILVNNSVARPMRNGYQSDASTFAQSMAVNATGLFVITRAFGDIMAEHRPG